MRHKKHEALVNNPLTQICINKTDNRLEFKIKYGSKLELQTQWSYLVAQKNNRETKNA